MQRISFRRVYFLLFFLFNLTNFSFSQENKETDTSVTVESNIDVKLFRLINNNRNGFSDVVIPVTDKSVLPVSLALPLGFMGISRIKSNHYDENSGVLLLLSELTSTGITFGMKQIFRRERPFMKLQGVNYNKDNSPTDKYSFPSGHTAITFSIAASLTLRYPDKPAIIAISYLYAAIAGYGRMYLGVHYPSDVLGGMLVGSGSAAIVYSLRKEIIDIKNDLFNEKGRQDINSSNGMTPGAVLGLSIGVDLMNNLITNTSLKNKLLLSAENEKLSARFLF